MTLQDAVRLAINSLRSAMLRSLLTILGLAVGVGAVLTVLALGDAGEIRVEEEIAKLGVNKVWIRSTNSRYHLCQQDATDLQAATNAPACAGAYKAAVVRLGAHQAVAQIAGYDDAMRVVHAPKLISGRMLRQLEFQQGSPVCLVDAALSESLGNDVLGKWLTVGNRCIRIIGIIKSTATPSLTAGKGMLIMPLNTFVTLFGEDIAEITLSVQNGQSAEAVAAQAMRTLPGTGFRADTLQEEIGAAREIVRVFVMVLFCVAAVCMLTGAIGVMNVLLISVRERRSEIGLMKALGGTNQQLGLLFILEAAAYAVVGSAMGIMLAYVMIDGFGSWTGLKAALRLPQTMTVILATTLLGLCAGVAPALAAARLQPVDALNCE